MDLASSLIAHGSHNVLKKLCGSANSISTKTMIMLKQLFFGRCVVRDILITFAICLLWYLFIYNMFGGKILALCAAHYLLISYCNRKLLQDILYK